MKIFKLLFPKHHRALVQAGANQKELEGICLEQINQIKQLEDKLATLDYELEDMEIQLEEKTRRCNVWEQSYYDARRSLTQQLQDAQGELESYEADLQDAQLESRELQDELNELQIQLENTQTELTLKEQEVYELQHELSTAQDELDAQREEF